jgi:hypothetical protein
MLRCCLSCFVSFEHDESQVMNRINRSMDRKIQNATIDIGAFGLIVLTCVIIRTVQVLWKIWCTIRTRIPSWYICYFCGSVVGIVSTGLSDPIVSGSSP